MSQWVIITGLATLLFAALARLAVPKARPAMRVWAIACGLLCAAFLIGPPVDHIAGAVIVVAMLIWAAFIWLTN